VQSSLLTDVCDFRWGGSVSTAARPQSSPQSSDQLADPASSNFRAFCLFDRGYVPSFEAERQAIEWSSGFRGIVQRIGQVRRLEYFPRLVVKLKINLNDIAFGNTRSSAICSAYPN
jgi:hypothetical protein